MSDTATNFPGMPVRDIQVFLSANGRPRAEGDRLLRGHYPNIDKMSPTDLVPAHTCFRIFQENASALGDERHHAGGGGQVKPGMTTLIISRMLVCKTISEALRAYADAIELIFPDIEVTVHNRLEGTCLRWSLRKEKMAASDIMLESMAVVFYSVFSWLADEELAVKQLCLPTNRMDSESTLCHVLKAPMVYEGDAVKICFSEDVADKKIVLKDVREWCEGVYSFLQDAALNNDASMVNGDFTKRVRAALLKGLAQKQIASVWGMSTKTISRRLGREGYSFRKLRDEIRKDKAESLIHTGISIEDMSSLVGYEDPRSFRRAFVRWFGANPSSYRNLCASASGPIMSAMEGPADPV